MVGFEEQIKTLSKDEAFAHADRCLSCPKPRCRDLGCPAHIDIPSFIKKLKERDINGAYEIIMEYTNLSPVCCRICDYEKQCRGHCILNFKKNPIPCGYLERFVQDNKTIELKPIEKWTSYKVAIVGGGPSGLSCALELVKKGIHATVYEKEPHIGGILAYGIPEYRLPKKVVNDYVDFLRRMGVEFVTSCQPDIKKLTQEYDRVFLGIGLGEDKRLHIPGEEGEGVYLANPFLKKVNYFVSYNEGKEVKLSGITYVVGAGNVAMDCCRTSVRVGSSKTVVVYRRAEEQAPASKEEIEDARKEGVEFNFLHNPVEVLLENNKVVGIKCEIMELGEKDASGRASPVGTGKYETFKCDNILVAIGSSPRKGALNDLGLELNHDYVVCKEDGITTSNPKILAGGDLVRGADTVVRAMVDGKAAANKIASELLG